MTGAHDDIHPADTETDRPLSDEQLTLARDVGRQIGEALRALLNCFPPEKRTAKAVGAHLKIDGVVARRLVRAANQTDDPITLLTRLPSVENLRKVQRATVADGITSPISAELLAGIDAFAAFVQTFGPGKAAMTRRLRATTGVGDDDEA